MIEGCRVSFVIPCFNHGRFLVEAVDSVQQLGREDVELIVVDDGSNDQRTVDEVERMWNSGIRVIRQENRGLAAARNAGVLAARGEYIFALDADDRLREGWIEEALRVLDSQPEVGVVYGDAQCFGANTERWVVGAFDRDRLLKWNFIHASALYRRAIWEQNGGYDGGMPVMGLEDWDFWLGALERGWKFHYLPLIFFDYRRAAGSMITKTASFEDEVKAFVARKHGVLYRQAWLSTIEEVHSLADRCKSIRWLSRRTSELLMERLGRTSKNVVSSQQSGS